MEKLQFSIDIHASRMKVWETLWDDKTFRQWAGLIDPGTYMKGELSEGDTVEFISAENGYGVTSLVAKLVLGEYLLLKHQTDTQDSGQRERADEWSGGDEEYVLKEQDGTTTLTAAFDVPSKMKELFEDLYPKALERVKELAEQA